MPRDGPTFADGTEHHMQTPGVWLVEGHLCYRDHARWWTVWKGSGLGFGRAHGAPTLRECVRWIEEEL